MEDKKYSIDKAIGVYITIDNCGFKLNLDEGIADVITQAIYKPANKTTEVIIKHNGIEKEFTFADFFSRLGFIKDFQKED